MRNILALLAAGLLIFAGVGWYLGWYKIQSTQNADGHRQISIDLNSPKINEDLNRGREKLRDLLSTKDNNPSTSQQNVSPRRNSTGTDIPVSFQRSEDGSYVIPSDPTLPAIPMPPSGLPGFPPKD